MSVYARAHGRAFTKDNILAAFEKTGVVPFNPDVVTEDMMAPSLETSKSSVLPLEFPSPVKEMMDLISHHQARKRKRTEDDAYEDQNNTPQASSTISKANLTDSPTYTPVRRGINALASTSAAFLVSDSPIASTSRLPSLQTFEISPVYRPHSLLTGSDSEPLTDRERLLMTALQDSHNERARLKEQMMGMQAQSLLQASYVEGVRIQLQTLEEKKSRGKKKARINTDGKPKILSQDEIFNAVVEGQAARDSAKEAATKRKDARGKYSDALVIWKAREDERKEINATYKEQWHKEVKKWEIERDSAKFDKRKPRWKKPKMPTMQKAIIKPKIAEFVEAIDEDEEEDEEEEDTAPESDSD